MAHPTRHPLHRPHRGHLRAQEAQGQGGQGEGPRTHQLQEQRQLPRLHGGDAGEEELVRAALARQPGARLQHSGGRPRALPYSSSRDTDRLRLLRPAATWTAHL